MEAYRPKINGIADLLPRRVGSRLFNICFIKL
jgi:hypothetical protein